MPASTKHILTNVERMRDDAELTALWGREATDDRAIGQVWSAFVQAADAAHIADRIPGSVGRTFKAKYAAEAGTEDSSKVGPGRSKSPTSKKATSTKGVK